MANEAEDVHCTPNPDIAGIGVVISVVAATFSTIIISIICGAMKLCWLYGEDDAHIGPLRWPSQSILRAMAPLLDERKAFWTATYSRKSLGLWHRVLSKALLGLGINQLVAGLALMVSCYCSYNILPDVDRHALLAMWMSASSVFSQLGIPFVLQRPNRNYARFSFGTAILYMHIVSILVTIKAPVILLGGAITSAALFAALLAVGYLRDFLVSSGPLSVVPSKNSKARIDAIPLFQIFGFSIACCFSLYGMVRMLQLKFGTDNPSCNLNDRAENQWTLGQILAVLMLLALMLPALGAYWEEMEELREADESASEEGEPIQLTIASASDQAAPDPPESNTSTPLPTAINSETSDAAQDTPDAGGMEDSTIFASSHHAIDE